MTELKVKLDAIVKLRRPGANGNTTGSFRSHQGGLSRHVVTLRGDKFQLVFERLADHDHAEEQALNAYPCGVGTCTLDDSLTWRMERMQIIFTTEILEALAANGRATREAQDRDERD
jgi:hypothetical protein